MRAFIGLGSNLESPVEQVLSAQKALDTVEDTKVIQHSSLYSSPPMGPQDQPDYINAVSEVETTLLPHALLDALQTIEQQQGRVRLRHWGERTLDLDLLLYGQDSISDERLTVPHPGIKDRAFVLYPLAEIAPELEIPGQGDVPNLLLLCPKEGLQRITDINVI